jgi:hypothetical protein
MAKRISRHLTAVRLVPSMAYPKDASSAVRVRGSVRTAGSAPLVRFATNVDYRQGFKPANEFVRIKF